MRIKTNRLQIREFEKTDWEAVYQYTSDPKVMKYIPEGIFSKKDAQQFVVNNRGAKAKHFAVTAIDTNAVMGHIVFHPYFGSHTYEIGWVFNSMYHGKGYAAEAAKGVLGYGFIQLNLHRIIATCQPENKPSYRVMEKIGMRREGFFKQCIPHGDEWWDEYYYAILREEFLCEK
ncbi:GNAT family N-acetyltransferase [Gracilibacillus alcaliphilus]|uniref:GNAT family N-acetyltransferase n=1 Tax=Gracilibacillus alcaliphilus TaxID=1401441 RepID=UPI00195ED7F1|nr:GNAT family protein [Gracilibacillus alcaliphilus]MBM7677598.1 RimJ/RimL family protein N-acetyltransferase [Gracilibacillus alcaliphilus]